MKDTILLNGSLSRVKGTESWATWAIPFIIASIFCRPVATLKVKTQDFYRWEGKNVEGNSYNSFITMFTMQLIGVKPRPHIDKEIDGMSQFDPDPNLTQSYH